MEFATGGQRVDAGVDSRVLGRLGARQLVERPSGAPERGRPRRVENQLTKAEVSPVSDTLCV